MVKGRRVCKLGSGCSLPSAVALMLGMMSVLATNHWEEGGRRGGKEDDSSRLMPKNPHGANLVHNVIPLGGIGSGSVPATSVRCLAWHNGERTCDIPDRYRPDLIIGLDIVYYPTDGIPLL